MSFSGFLVHKWDAVREMLKEPSAERRFKGHVDALGSHGKELGSKVPIYEAPVLWRVLQRTQKKPPKGMGCRGVRRFRRRTTKSTQVGQNREVELSPIARQIVLACEWTEGLLFSPDGIRPMLAGAAEKRIW